MTVLYVTAFVNYPESRCTREHRKLGQVREATQVEAMRAKRKKQC